MRTLGNILWHIPFLGFINAVVIYLLGVILTITVIASPLGLGLMEFGKFLFWPFGHKMIDKSALNTPQNPLWKTYSLLIMLVYLPLGLILAIFAIFQMIGLFISILGIPVALVIAKSLGTYVSPINKVCVHATVADDIEKKKYTR